MKRLSILVAVLALAGACKKNKAEEVAPPPATAKTAAGSDTAATAGSGSAAVSACAAETTQLKTWIGSVMDRSQTVAAPSPTGDAAFDGELAKLVAASPKRNAPNLAWQHKVETRLDSELAACPQWAAAKAKAEDVTRREDYREPWPALADAIAACECKPSIAHVKALLYLRVRGPA